MTRRPFEPAGVFDTLRQNSRMTVSGDGKTTFFGEANISSGPIHLYDSVTDSFVASSGIGEFVDNKATAINHDGSMIAISHGGRIRIYDRDFNLVDATIAEHAFGLAFSADSQFIYALSGNSLKIEIYRLSDGANVGEIDPGENFAGAFGRYEMLITHDGTKLIMQSRAGVRVYPIFEAAPHFVTVGPDEHVSGVDFGLLASSAGPGARDDDLTVPKDAVKASLNVLANDYISPGVSRSVTAFSATTAGGTPLIENGNLFYTPPAGFVGKDSFFYTLTDGNNASDTAHVTVHVGVPNANESVAGRVVDESSQGIPGATLFLDLNNNGVHNEGEPTQRADVNGNYSFNDLADDEYTLRQFPEPGYDLALTATGAAARDFIPMPNRASFAYDESREALWILEAPSMLWHYDLTTRQMIGNWDLGEKLSRIDIASDGSFALITGPDVVAAKASVLRIDLTTKAVTKLEYAVGGGEVNSFDIAIFDQGFALFSGKFSGSGWVPIRQLDLATNAITTRAAAPTSVRQNTNIYRSEDRQHGLVAEANASNGPVLRFDPVTNSFPISKGIQEFAGRLKADVTSTYFAGNTTTATSIVEMSTLDTIEILSTLCSRSSTAASQRASRRLSPFQRCSILETWSTTTKSDEPR